MCGIAVSSSRVKEAVLHGIAVPVIWPLMSNVGQYLEDFRLNSQWIHNFGQLLYDQEIGATSNDLAFRSLYRSIRDLLTFSCEGWLEVHCWCIHARDKKKNKKTSEMDTAWPIINAVSVFRRFSTRDNVFANFSYGIAVPLMSPSSRGIPKGTLNLTVRESAKV